MPTQAFDLYENKNPISRRQYPYLVDLQSPLLKDVLNTRLVAPVARASTIKLPIAVLTPVVRHEEDSLVVDIPQMAAVASKALGPRVGTLAEYRGVLIAAIDRLITGS